MYISYQLLDIGYNILLIVPLYGLSQIFGDNILISSFVQY